jgi:hypothetical protein
LTATGETIEILALLWLALILSGSYAAPKKRFNFLPLINFLTLECPREFGDECQSGDMSRSFLYLGQASEDVSNNFAIWILEKGRSNSIVMITTKGGQSFEKPYQTTFKDKVEEAKQRGIPFVQKCD